MYILYIGFKKCPCYTFPCNGICCNRWIEPECVGECCHGSCSHSSRPFRTIATTTISAITLSIVYIYECIDIFERVYMCSFYKLCVTGTVKICICK